MKKGKDLLNTLRIKKIQKASVAREIKATAKAYKAGKKINLKAVQKSRAVRKKKKDDNKR